MNHAVGRPKINVKTVVMSDRDSERQKIDKCASAQIKVSSKMSRWTTVFFQPSSENSHFTLP